MATKKTGKGKINPRNQEKIKPKENQPPCKKGYIRDSNGNCIEDPG